MDLLVFLAARAGQVVPKTQLIDEVWRTEFIADSAAGLARNDTVVNPLSVQTDRGLPMCHPDRVSEENERVDPFDSQSSLCTKLCGRLRVFVRPEVRLSF